MNRQAFSIVFLLSLSGAASAQTALTADELAARNIAARGGLEKVRALHSMSGKGSMLLPNGLEVPVTLYLKRPGLMRVDANIQGKSMVIAFDGTDSWTINPFAGSGEPQRLNEAESNSAREDSVSMLDGELVDYKEKGSQLEPDGTEDVGGRPSHKLKVTTKSGTVHYIYLDDETFLDSKVVQVKSEAGHEKSIEIFLTAYKPVAGVMTAHSVEMKKDGIAVKFILEKVAGNVDIEDSLFQFPTPRVEQP
jgi:outer membrane lipoprotein-sorting protein